MIELFYKGGWQFMTTLSILLVITTIWIICHFIIAYRSKQTKQVKFLHRIGYGKTMGLFTLMVGICGQMIGLYSAFQICEAIILKGIVIKPESVIEGIKLSMIVTIYGTLIYLFSVLLWFLASLLIKKKVESLHSN